MGFRIIWQQMILFLLQTRALVICHRSGTGEKLPCPIAENHLSEMIKGESYGTDKRDKPYILL